MGVNSLTAGARLRTIGAAQGGAGRYDEALEQFREVPDPDANSEFRRRRMAAIYERKGVWTESMNKVVIARKYGGKKELVVSVQRVHLVKICNGQADFSRGRSPGDAETV